MASVVALHRHRTASSAATTACSSRGWRHRGSDMNEIDALIAEVNKEMKSEVLVYASEIPSFRRVTTGSLSFDLALGGGWPLNCWNEIIGNESHGKTVIVLKTLAANMAIDP